jgi:hypothetical protein
VQDKAALALDRPADQNRSTPGGFGTGDVQSAQDSVEVDAGRRAINAQTHGVIGTVGADEDDRVFETWISDAGHGDQQVSGKGFEIDHILMIGTKPSWRKAVV